MQPIGVPATDLTDEELESQGARAHATRNWVFLHGTADQYRHHTDRMLELEREYLRRHPKRTWQGSDDADTPVDAATELRVALRGIAFQIEALLSKHPANVPAASMGDDAVRGLLQDVAAQPGGRIHRLELHQLARKHGVPASEMAQLYRSSPRLMAVDQADRVLTEDGRRWLET